MNPRLEEISLDFNYKDAFDLFEWYRMNKNIPLTNKVEVIYASAPETTASKAILFYDKSNLVNNLILNEYDIEYTPDKWHIQCIVDYIKDCLKSQHLIDYFN